MTRPASLLGGHCLDLLRHNLQDGIRQGLRGGLYPLQQKVTPRAWPPFLQPKQFVGRYAQHNRYAQQRSQIRLTIPADIVGISPLTQPNAAGRFGIRNAKFNGSRSQVFAKRFHATVLFWKARPRYALSGRSDSTILFILGGAEVEGLFVGCRLSTLAGNSLQTSGNPHPSDQRS